MAQKLLKTFTALCLFLSYSGLITICSVCAGCAGFICNTDQLESQWDTDQTVSLSSRDSEALAADVTHMLATYFIPWKTTLALKQKEKSDFESTLISYIRNLLPRETTPTAQQKAKSDFESTLISHLKKRGFAITENPKDYQKTYQLSFMVDVLDSTGQYYITVRVGHDWVMNRLYSHIDDNLEPSGATTILSNNDRAPKPHLSSTRIAALDNTPVGRNHRPFHKPPQTWEVKPGSLMEQLNTWCERNGYQMIWLAPFDYILTVSATIDASFEYAMESLIKDCQLNGMELYANMYKGNQIMVITGD